MCRNLPFGGRATRDSRVCLPRKENARSRHQRLFEENVGKIGKKTWSTNFKWKVWELYLCTGKVLAPHASITRDDSLLIKCANMTSISFMFSFYAFISFCAFYIFYLFVVDKGVSLAPTYSSIVVRKSDLRSSLRTKRWLNYFYPFLQDIFWLNERSFKAFGPLNNLSILLKGEKTLRHWTINNLLFFWKRWQSYVLILGFRNPRLTNKSGKDHFKALDL